jgi:Asp/Glu/hydantoin racemase
MNSSRQRQSLQKRKKRNRDEWTVFCGGRIGISEIVDRTDKDTNSPVVDPDPFADKVSVDAALVHEAAIRRETITTCRTSDALTGPE